MTSEFIVKAYDFSGQTMLVTGGTGILCSEMARALLACGANVAIVGRSLQNAQRTVTLLQDGSGRAKGGKAFAVQANVLEPETVQAAVDLILAEFGQIDGLINGAGGNRPEATTSAEKRFFDLPKEAFRTVVDLNLLGTIIPAQIVGRHMAERKQGVILNVTSMAAFRPLTRVLAYSAAKAGVSNFTQWLAVHMAQEYSPAIRVNAIAPGFFLTEQNRYLMTDKETGDPTPRGKKVMEHTPLGRYGSPSDLSGTVLWLLSPASAFVTGIVVPVDGGFSAYSGV